MSARGSTAKISSLSSMSPPALASRVCTLTFILAFLALFGRALALGLGLVRRSVRCILFRRSGFGFRLDFAVERAAGFLLGRDRRDFLVARKRRDLVDRRVVDQARLGDVNFLFLQGLEDPGRERRVLVARQLDRVADRQPAAL